MTGIWLVFEEAVGVLIGAPVGSERREFADDEAFNERLDRLIVVLVRSVIADLRVSENDDLARVRGSVKISW
jgi:hypothetical protein